MNNIAELLIVSFLIGFLVLLPAYCVIKGWNAPKQVIDHEWNKTESPIQRRVLAALRNNGYSPRTEIPCGRYRIDIAFPAYKLAIETDGAAHHTSPKDKAHDRRKDRYLRRHGWKVLRFTGRRINRDIKGVVRRIEDELRKRV